MKAKEVVNYISRKELVSEIVEKKEKGFIYSKSIGYQYEYVGFWMRMFGEHFRPCQKCQLDILKLLKTSQWDFNKGTMNVTFQQRFYDEEKLSPYYEFGLPFLLEANNVWKPCKDCQNVIGDIVQSAKSIHIGNKDYAYPIELYKEYDIDDKSWKVLEKRIATKEEIEDKDLRID